MRRLVLSMYNLCYFTTPLTLDFEVLFGVFV